MMCCLKCAEDRAINRDDAVECTSSQRGKSIEQGDLGVDLRPSSTYSLESSTVEGISQL